MQSLVRRADLFSSAVMEQIHCFSSQFIPRVSGGNLTPSRSLRSIPCLGCFFSAKRTPSLWLGSLSHCTAPTIGMFFTTISQPGLIKLIFHSLASPKANVLLFSLISCLNDRIELPQWPTWPPPPTLGIPTLPT